MRGASHFTSPRWARYLNRISRRDTASSSSSSFCLANGCTGTIAGDRPYSWIKITLAVLAGLILVGLIVAIANGGR